MNKAKKAATARVPEQKNSSSPWEKNQAVTRESEYAEAMVKIALAARTMGEQEANPGWARA